MTLQPHRYFVAAWRTRSFQSVSNGSNGPARRSTRIRSKIARRAVRFNECQEIFFLRMRPNGHHSFPQRCIQRVRQSNRDSRHIGIMLFLFCLGKRWIAFRHALACSLVGTGGRFIGSGNPSQIPDMVAGARLRIHLVFRYRFWGSVNELQGRFLRVVTLSDKLTIHNAFLDRRFQP